MNLAFILFVHVYLVAFTSGEQCQKLDGLWYNALGSHLQLNHSEDRVLRGTYFPVGGELGVDSEANVPSDLTGAAVYNQTGAVFSLSVMWMNGASVKAWMGQCFMVGNDEQLETSWLVRQRADGCSDKWLTTSIGDMVFKRQLNANALKNFGNSQRKPGSAKRNKRPKYVKEATPGPRQPCSLEGHWYNELGSEMFIAYHQNTTIRGLYRTAVERYNGSAGTGESIVYGMANELDTSTAIAFYVVWNNGGSVAGWVGQCQFCGPNQTEIITTVWLLKAKVDSYENNWSAAYVGYNYFTRYEQKPGITRYQQNTAPN